MHQLTFLLAEIGLNIQEAHAFSTVDGFSLDVFVVDGWAREVRPYPYLIRCLLTFYIFLGLHEHIR